MISIFVNLQLLIILNQKYINTSQSLAIDCYYLKSKDRDSKDDNEIMS